MLKFVLRYLSAISVLTALIANAQTATTVRSGNGAVGGTDSAVTFLQGPGDSDFANAFTATDFSNAQNGPAAFIAARNSAWITGLSEDPSAQWIGTNPNAAYSGGTALYAINVGVPDAFSTATLTLHYAVDDNLGGIHAGGVNPGVFLNGTYVCVNLVPVGTFSAEQTINCNDIAQVLNVGDNWLYFDAVNLEAGAGLLFSATITTSQTPSMPSINSGGVVNAASYTAPVAPGSIAAAYGDFLLGSPSEALAIPLPTNI